ncbi:MAG: DUF4265 domain-containing protein [Oceanospirillaceae bacterium]|nr:DUF4265 domain-containing protein [Oceanospirillaceae bacterium]
MKNQWHGYESESVWAEKISNDRCRIRNTPFYAKGVSFEDVVFVREKKMLVCGLRLFL